MSPAAPVQPERLGSRQAEATIREVAADSNNVVLTNHAKEQMLARGWSIRQVRGCLQRGTVSEGPFVNAHGNWQCTLQRFAAGNNVKVAVAIDWPAKLIVITVI